MSDKVASCAGGARAQRGVALITALLIVSLVVVAAAAMASRQQLDIRRTGNLLHGEQAYAYVVAAESWARVVLNRDLRDNKVDTLEEDWATKPPVSMVEGGMVTGCILDLQGRFNLNSVVVAGKKDASGVIRYKRLLEALDLDAALAGNLVDWIDENVNAEFPDGAEDDYYLLQQPSYRTANQALVNLSELRLIKDYDEEVIEALMPYVTALPDPRAPINVNTASAQALLTVSDKLPLADAEKLIEQRPKEGGFTDINDFLKLPELSGPRAPDPATVSVQSEWFVLLSRSDIGQARATFTAQLYRTASGTVVVQRRRDLSDGLQCNAPSKEVAAGGGAAAGGAEFTG